MSATTQRPVSHRLKTGIRSALFVLVALGLIELSDVGVFERRVWIDPVTRSSREQTRWLGCTISTVVRKSELEKWIVDHRGEHKNAWSNLGGTYYSLFGRTGLRACSLAPEIYGFPESLLTEFVQHSSDEEISRFLEVMMNGTHDEKIQIIDATALAVMHRDDV